MAGKILDYYKKLLATDNIYCAEQLAADALKFLSNRLPDASSGYLRRQPWPNLSIGLHANGAQVCAQCYEVREGSDFARLLDFRSICRACLAANKRRRLSNLNETKKAKRHARRLADEALRENGAPGPVRRRYLQAAFRGL